MHKRTRVNTYFFILCKNAILQMHSCNKTAHTHWLTHYRLGRHFFTIASRGQTSHTGNEKQKSEIWMEIGGMKGRACWQQQNHRQSHWALSWNPSATGTKLRWHWTLLHYPSTSKKFEQLKCFVSVTLALLHLQLTLKVFTGSWTCIWSQN